MSRTDLALIVPCYDEAARLHPQAFLDFVAAHPYVCLVMVDDGSTDETGRMLDELQAQAPTAIGVIHLSSNRGKAEAVRVGILEGIRREAASVGFWDADLSTPLTVVDDFLALMQKRPAFEVILGSRVMVMGRDIRRSAWRHYLGRVFATAASLTLNLPVYDTQCGAKIFRVNDAIAAAFATPFRSRWIFDVEILARYLAHPVPPGHPSRRSRIYELVVPAWHDRAGTKLRWVDFIRAMFDLLGIWRDRARAVRAVQNV